MLRRVFKEYALERRRGLRTSFISAICKSIKSRKRYVLLFMGGFIGSPQSARRSASKAQDWASALRRKVFEAYCHKEKKMGLLICTRKLPDMSFKIVAITCAIPVQCQSEVQGTSGIFRVHTAGLSHWSITKNYDKSRVYIRRCTHDG